MPDEETAKYDRGKQHSIFQKMLYKRTDITRKHNKRWNKREHFNNFTRMSSSSRVYNKNHPRQPVTVLEIQSLGMGRVIKKLAATVTRKSRLLLTILKKWQPCSRRLLMQPKPKAVSDSPSDSPGDITQRYCPLWPHMDLKVFFRLPHDSNLGLIHKYPILIK
ncbi:hypothetical protein ACOSP7_020454 [Xanthoceras sorbifolium]